VRADLPDRGVRLTSLRLRHPRVPELRAALDRLGDPGITLAVEEGAPGMSFTLETPDGPRSL